MRVVFAIIAAIMALGIVADNNKDKVKGYIVVFAVSAIAIIILSILKV